MGSIRANLLLVAAISLHAVTAPSAQARCASGTTAVWPAASASLAPRPEIIVQGYGTTAGSVEQIGSHNPLLVSTRGHRVPLNVVMVQRGDFRLTQAVLRTDRDLRVGDVYQLRINGRLRRDIKGNVARWTVAAMPTEPNAWNAPPRAQAAESLAYGCGPAESIPVTVDVSTHQSARYRVWLWRDGGDEATAQVFDIMPPTHDAALRVGHGMCNGAFDPPSGTRVWFRVALVDGAGREVPAPGAPMSAIFP